MPPDNAIAVPSVRVSSSESLVRSVRTSTQSGSFAHRRPCIQERASVLRIAVSALNWVVFTRWLRVPMPTGPFGF